MDYFLDIELRPDPEFVAHLLLAEVYAKLHLRLAPDNSLGIAVCFPGYQASPPSLGTRLRLLGSNPALQTLASGEWLNAMNDHVKVGALARVPVDITHRLLRRVQAKSSPERLRRRLMKRHDFDEVQARERIPDAIAEKLALPFLQLHSRSTFQVFRLFLSLGPAQAAPVEGNFNAYGLSKTATIPWF